MVRSDAVARIRRGRVSGAAGRRPAASLLAVALVVPFAAAGCATKKDVKLLSEQVEAMQARQEAIFAELHRQNRAVLDSMRVQSETLLRVRGDLGHQMLQLQQDLVRVQELAGLSHAELARLYDQIEQNRQAMQRGAQPGSPGGDGEADDLYAAGVELLNLGNAETARVAFQDLLELFPAHPLAPDAQYQLAETYLRAEPPQPARAIEEFERVVSMYPDSEQAPRALFRAAVIAEERGDRSKARELFDRVVLGYPGSEAAAQARARTGRD